MVEEAVLSGKMPMLRFDVAPELNDSLTMQLYKWANLSDLFLTYTGIQDRVANGQNTADLKLLDILRQPLSAVRT